MRGSSKNIMYDKNSRTGLQVRTKDDDDREKEEERKADEKIEEIKNAAKKAADKKVEELTKINQELKVLRRRIIFCEIKKQLKEEFGEVLIAAQFIGDESEDYYGFNLDKVITENNDFSLDDTVYSGTFDFVLENESIRDAIEELEECDPVYHGKRFTLNRSCLKG